MVFVSKLLLVKVSCNMGVNNTITTASSSSSGATRCPRSFLTRNTCYHTVTCNNCLKQAAIEEALSAHILLIDDCCLVAIIVWKGLSYVVAQPIHCA